MSDPRALVQKLWNYCNVLRDDGLSYGEYVEQLTYLLFLKMADEQTRPPFNRDAVVPYGLDWQSLLDRDGDELEAHYIKILNELGRHPGMLGVIFRKAQNRIQDPAKLRRLVVDLIDQEQWMSLDTDVKATPTRASSRRTPRTSSQAPASTSHLVRWSGRSST
jgi:type I restriction enzyme M protein